MSMILNTDLFSFRVVFAVLHLQTFSPRLEFAQTRFFFKERLFDTLEFVLFRLACDDEGERGKIKIRTNISLFKVINMVHIVELFIDLIPVST